MASSDEEKTELAHGEAAHKAIRKHFPTLMKVVATGDIVENLYANEIIEESTFEVVTAPTSTLSNKQKGTKILKDVQITVNAKPKHFQTFCDVLKAEGHPDLVLKLKGPINILSYFNSVAIIILLRLYVQRRYTDIRLKGSVCVIAFQLVCRRPNERDLAITSIRLLKLHIVHYSGTSINWSPLCQRDLAALYRCPQYQSVVGVAWLHSLIFLHTLAYRHNICLTCRHTLCDST